MSILNLMDAVEALGAFFGNDEKTMYWLTTLNPHFGCAPSELIKSGRGHKVYKWIEIQLEERK